MSGERTNQTYENFKSAFATLKKFVAQPVEDDRDRAGIIQAFEFTYELAWKTFQKVATDQGLEAKSPKQALQAAFALGIITSGDEELWLQIASDRNLCSHVYKDEVAKEVLSRILATHVAGFERVLKELKSQKH